LKNCDFSSSGKNLVVLELSDKADDIEAVFDKCKFLQRIETGLLALKGRTQLNNCSWGPYGTIGVLAKGQSRLTIRGGHWKGGQAAVHLTDNAKATLADCIIEGQTKTALVLVQEAHLTMRNGVLSNNHGYGLHVRSATAFVSQSKVMGNKKGGLFVESSGLIEYENVTFKGNQGPDHDKQGKGRIVER
jgi:hypothetical protein